MENAKKIEWILRVAVGTLLISGSVSAQGMMGGSATDVRSATQEKNAGHTEKAEAEGKVFWENLQEKKINCEDLSDDQFEPLGMYFMGLMTGKSHEAMDAMMEKMMGEDGEKQMHVAMGKRMSGCEPNAPMPQGMADGGMMQMMMGGGMMGDGLNPLAVTTNNANNPMMNFGFTPFGWMGGIFMILFWVLVIVGVVVLIKGLTHQNRDEGKGSRSAIDILKERYAKGEIDKKEFEERKKDVS